MLSERCDLDNCLGWVCEFHSLRKDAQEYIAALEASVQRLFAAWYECPQDSVPDVLQDVFIELESKDA